MIERDNKVHTYKGLKCRILKKSRFKNKQHSLNGFIIIEDGDYPINIIDTYKGDMDTTINTDKKDLDMPQPHRNLEGIEDLLIYIIEKTSSSSADVQKVFNGITYKGMDLGKYINYLWDVYRNDKESVEKRLIELKRGLNNDNSGSPPTTSNNQTKLNLTTSLRLESISNTKTSDKD